MLFLLFLRLVWHTRHHPFPILSHVFLDHLHPHQDDVPGYDFHVTEPTEHTLVDALNGIKTMLGRLGVDGPDGGMGGIELLCNVVASPDGPSLADAVAGSGAGIASALDRIADALHECATAISAESARESDPE